MRSLSITRSIKVSILMIWVTVAYSFVVSELCKTDVYNLVILNTNVVLTCMPSFFVFFWFCGKFFGYRWQNLELPDAELGSFQDRTYLSSSL